MWLDTLRNSFENKSQNEITEKDWVKIIDTARKYFFSLEHRDWTKTTKKISDEVLSVPNAILALKKTLLSADKKNLEAFLKSEWNSCWLNSSQIWALGLLCYRYWYWAWLRTEIQGNQEFTTKILNFCYNTESVNENEEINSDISTWNKDVVSNLEIETPVLAPLEVEEISVPVSAPRSKAVFPVNEAPRIYDLPEVEVTAYRQLNAIEEIDRIELQSILSDSIKSHIDFRTIGLVSSNWKSLVDSIVDKTTGEEDFINAIMSLATINKAWEIVLNIENFEWWETLYNIIREKILLVLDNIIFNKEFSEQIPKIATKRMRSDWGGWVQLNWIWKRFVKTFIPKNFKKFCKDCIKWDDDIWRTTQMTMDMTNSFLTSMEWWLTTIWYKVNKGSFNLKLPEIQKILDSK